MKRAAAALTVAPPVSAFVVLARHSVSIGDRTAVSGANVGVRGAGTQNTYAAGFDTRTAVGFDTIAPRITLNDRAMTGNLDASLVVRAPHAVTGSISPFIEPPTPPSTTGATVGAGSITVTQGSVATLSAGNLNNVVVGGTLNLSGGLYQMRNLRVDNDGRIVAQAPTIIRIASGLSAGDRAHILPAAGLRAADLVIEAAGTVVNSDGVSLGHDVQLTALVVANRGFRCSDRLIASGAIAAQDVNVGLDARVSFDSGFACATDADCGGTGACAATCVDTQCRRPPRCSAVQISAHNDHACAAMADGTASCWGDNADGNLGRNDQEGRLLAPAPVLAQNADGTISPLTGVREVAAVLLTSCALLTDGTVSCWGLLPNRSSLALVAVPLDGVSGAVAIASGGGQLCALLRNGDAVCWTSFQAPLAPLGISGATALAVGGAYACALTTARAVICWGHEDAGQFGDQGVNVTVDPTAAVTVPGLTDAIAVSAADSGHHVCALRASGDVVCWGRNDHGEIGDGSTPAGQIVGPTTVLGGAVAIAAGTQFHTCAALASGTVECWGADDGGQLGDGTSGNDAFAPSAGRAAIGVTSASRVSAGQSVSCAVQRDGRAFCWGVNGDAQLGNAPGNQPPSPIPLQVQF